MANANDKTDALVALKNMKANGFDLGLEEGDYLALDAAIEALAATAASVDVEGLRALANQIERWADLLPVGSGDACEWAASIRRLIDSAGGAKGELSMDERMARLAAFDPGAYVHIRGPIDQNCGSVWERQSGLYEQMQAVARANGFDSMTHVIATLKQTPQPAEGDGAVGEVLDMKYNVALFYPRGERPYLQPGTKLYTRPAATAVVPAFDFDRARTLIGYVTGYCNATTLKTLSSDACVALRDLAAMLAAAPAAPKGGVVDGVTTAGMADEYRRWIDFYHAGEGDFADFMRREYPDQSEFATTPTEQGATGEQP